VASHSDFYTTVYGEGSIPVNSVLQVFE